MQHWFLSILKIHAFQRKEILLGIQTILWHQRGNIDVNIYSVDVFVPEEDFTMCRVTATGPGENWNTLKFPNVENMWSHYLGYSMPIHCSHAKVGLHGQIGWQQYNVYLVDEWTDDTLIPLGCTCGSINRQKLAKEPRESITAPNEASCPKNEKCIKGTLEGGKRKKWGWRFSAGEYTHWVVNFSPHVLWTYLAWEQKIKVHFFRHLHFFLMWCFTSEVQIGD